MAGSWSNQLLDQPGYITGSRSNLVQPSGRSGFKNTGYNQLLLYDNNKLVTRFFFLDFL